jgi:hypothetical protein
MVLDSEDFGARENEHTGYDDLDMIRTQDVRRAEPRPTAR